jgi:hypothetical protein
METKFKIGDRVYHHPEGTGTVTGYQDRRVIVDPDIDDFYEQPWLCEEDSLEPAAPKSCYYYEEVTRNGRQWFRISPKGEWMPKPETVEQKYDRAGMATAAMKGLIQGITWIDEGGIICNRPQEVAEIAVTYADALIAELQRTEK